jgi:prevent-host-death family protein
MNRRSTTMPKTVSSTEAKTQFGTLLRWASEKSDEVIVKFYGEPKAVIMPYQEYEAFLKLREKERRRQAWEAVEEIRRRVEARTPDLTREEAYRLAGFSEEVIQETIQKDQELAQA